MKSFLGHNFLHNTDHSNHPLNFLGKFAQKTYCLDPLLLLTLLFSLIIVCKWINKNNPKRKNLPPSPPRLPILGNLHQLGHPPHSFFRSLSRKYGELMLLRLGCKPILVVSSANAASEVLKTHDVVFSNRPKSIAAKKFFYDGKDLGFANYGKYWRQMKSICMTQMLSTTRVQSFQAIREEETIVMLENITRLAPSVVNLTEIIKKLSKDVVCRAAFGKKYSEENFSNFMVIFDQMLELLSAIAIRDFIPWMGWIDRLNGLEYKIDQVANEFDAFLDSVIEEHMQNLDISGKRQHKQDKTKDLVDVLLDVQTDNTNDFSIDRECIKGVIMDMFAGGTGTTSAALEWAMSELIKHPPALRKLQEELRAIAHGKPRLNEMDLVKTEYLKAVIKETLRLYPPGPLLLFRESSQDVSINGYDIPANTQVIINAWAIQRDPLFWVEPDKFHPERFLNSTVDVLGQDTHFIPFGAGRRICPGIGFGTAVLQLALANLVYAFDWGLPNRAKPETLDMTETTGVALCRRHPLLVVATPYLHNSAYIISTK